MQELQYRFRLAQLRKHKCHHHNNPNFPSEIEEEVNVAIEFFPGRVKRDEWAKQAAELAK